MVERARPEFRGRLIAATQLTRSPDVAGTSAAMVDALVEETEAHAQPVDFQKIVPLDRLRRFGMLALVVFVMGLGGSIYGRAVTVGLLKRVFLSNIPVPRKTRVVVIDGNKIVGRGDSVRLRGFRPGNHSRHGASGSSVSEPAHAELSLEKIATTKSISADHRKRAGIVYLHHFPQRRSQ